MKNINNLKLSLTLFEGLNNICEGNQSLPGKLFYLLTSFLRSALISCTTTTTPDTTKSERVSALISFYLIHAYAQQASA